MTWSFAPQLIIMTGGCGLVCFDVMRGVRDFCEYEGRVDTEQIPGIVGEHCWSVNSLECHQAAKYPICWDET